MTTSLCTRATRRRVAVTFALAALSLSSAGCPPFLGSGGGPPDVETCGEAPEDAALVGVDGVEVNAFFETGNQGATMVMAAVRWRGDDVPTCMRAEIELRDPEGELVGSQTVSLQTEPVEGGRAATTEAYFIEERLCDVTVEVRSYGHGARAEARNTTWPCSPPPDAGADDAGASIDDGGADE
ncbi:MAG TPA: hypothetical protein RMH99_25460 [Sandaracinaceae bacterium LLY-WYZ-13_1]|nr:hypothetical protein [Sandaracinaceae bacterium LLY-WYZ-13_1]